MEKGQLSIHAENLLPIIKKWLYSDQDIFVRELISNGCDAIAKRKTMGLMHEDTPQIQVNISKENKTLFFCDNGIGMRGDEVKKYINQVAFSGASEFLEKYKDNHEQIIGHFGLGFYSAFMVADRVHIDTLSAQEGAVAVSWESDGGMEYEMGESQRQEPGTTITLFLNDESLAYLESATLRATLDKYCSFMPVPIYLTVEGQPENAAQSSTSGEDAPPEPQMINTPSPLYLRPASELNDDEYKAFYRDTFHDWEEPLFWIHLNADYPFNMKGILYFPRVKNEYAGNEGQVKLYANQVFVADNIKEVIPEFLLLLKGVVDCPDLPLNVSRSFLQNDGYVKKLSEYITRKVADKLSGMFKNDRENYDKYWDDINLFIKYGCLRDGKFYDRMKDCLIYKRTDGSTLTLPQYLDAAKENHENTVFYTPDPQRQASTLALYAGMDVVVLGSAIDNAFMQHIEMQNPGVHFQRIDADASAAMKGEGDALPEETVSALTELFAWALENENIKLSVENLKDPSIPAVILQDENMRRYVESMRLWANGSMPELPVEQTLLLNGASPLIQALAGKDKDDATKELCLEVRDLAELSQQALSPEKMAAFLQRTMKLISKLA